MKKLVKCSSETKLPDPFKYPRKSLKKLLKMIDSDDVADDIVNFLTRTTAVSLIAYIGYVHDIDFDDEF